MSPVPALHSQRWELKLVQFTLEDGGQPAEPDPLVDSVFGQVLGAGLWSLSLGHPGFERVVDVDRWVC